MNPYERTLTFCCTCGDYSISPRKDGRLVCNNGCNLLSARECCCGGMYKGPADRCDLCLEVEANKDVDDLIV